MWFNGGTLSGERGVKEAGLDREVAEHGCLTQGLTSSPAAA